MRRLLFGVAILPLVVCSSVVLHRRSAEPVVSVAHAISEGAEGSARVRLRFGADADPRSLQVRLDGEDVTRRFRHRAGGAAGRIEGLGGTDGRLVVELRDRGGQAHWAETVLRGPAPEPRADMGRAREAVRDVLDAWRGAIESPNPAREVVGSVEAGLVLIDALLEGEGDGDPAGPSAARIRVDIAELARVVATMGDRIRERSRVRRGRLDALPAARRSRALARLLEVERRLASATRSVRELLVAAAEPGVGLEPLREELAGWVRDRTDSGPGALRPPMIAPQAADPPETLLLEKYLHSARGEPGGDPWGLGHHGDPSELLAQPASRPAGWRRLLAKAVGNEAHAAPLDPDLAPATGVRFDSADPDDPILRRAAALGFDPIEIYAFVRNEIEFEAYGGLTRGARATLAGRRGNNPDQVALLVALMRASGYRARFVVGDIVVEQQRARRWLQLHHFQAVLRVLRRFVPQPVRAGEGVALFEHWWAKVEVPHGVEQGRNLDAALRWIFLDPSFKEHAVGSTPGLAFEGIDFGLELGTGGYLASVRSRTLSEFHADRQRARLLALAEPASLADLDIRGPIVRDENGSLPSALPYRAVQYHVEFADIDALADVPLAPTPDALDRKDLLRPRLLVEARDRSNGAVLLSHRLPVADAADRMVALRWVAASTTDQDLIDALCDGDLSRCGGGMGIELRLSLEVDGQVEVVSAASRPLSFGVDVVEIHGGTTHALFQNMGDGAVDLASYYRLVMPTLVAGEPAVLVSDVGQGSEGLTQGAMLELLDAHRDAGLLHPGGVAPDPADLSFPLVGGLHQRLVMGVLHLGALRYMQSVRDSLAEMTGLEEVAFATAGVGSTKAHSTVQFLGGTAVSIVPRNLVIDMGYFALGLGSGAVSERAFEADMIRFVLLSASDLEHRVWEELTQYESISTVKGLQALRENPGQGTSTFSLAPGAPLPPGTSVATRAYRSQFPQHTFLGHTGEIRLNDWVGSVFYAESLDGSSRSAIAGIGGSVYANGGYTTAFDPERTIDVVDAHALVGTGENATRAGDPVNVVSGNFDHSETDIRIPTIGSTPLELVRTYNSQSHQMGPFGFGWSHTYDVHLEAIDDDVDGIRDAGDEDGVTSGVALIDGSGSRRRFRFETGGDATGPFEPEAGEKGRLAVDGDTLVHWGRDGTRFHFPRFGSSLPAVGDSVSLDQIVDSHGNAIHLHYDESPRRLRVEDPLGRELVFRYDASERLVVAVDDWTGRTWRYAYADDELVAATNPLDAAEGRVTRRYAYERSSLRIENDHNLSRIEDALGHATTIEYYAGDQVYRTLDAAGAETRFVYDVFRMQTHQIGPLGGRTVYRFDRHGRVVRVIQADGAVEDNVYDPVTGDLLERIDAAGHRWRWTYDGRHNVKTALSPSGALTQLSYWYEQNVGSELDPRTDQLVERIDPVGTVFGYAYGPGGSLARETVRMQVEEGEGPVLRTVDLRRYEYTAHGQLAKLIENIDPASPAPAAGATDAELEARVTRYTYDSSAPHHRIRMEQQGGASVAYVWDTDLEPPEPDRGQVRERRLDRIAAYPETEPGAPPEISLAEQVETRTYDELGRLLVLTLPSGTERDHRYDAGGRLAEVIERGRDADGVEVERATTHVYDENGRLAQVIDPLGGILQRHYDLAGRLVRRVDRTGRATRFRFDARGRGIGWTDGSGRATRLVRDASGRIVEQVDPAGGRTRWRYDAEGRLIEQLDADGVAAQFVYDLAGRRVGERSGRLVVGETHGNALGFSHSFEHDELGRLVATRGPDEELTRIGYDLLDNAVRVTDAEGREWKQEFDRLGRLRARVDPLGRVERFGYDTVGSPITHERPTGELRTFHYDGEGLQVAVAYRAEIDGREVRRDLVAFDGFGNRVFERGPIGVTLRSYDALGRLVAKVDDSLGFAQHYGRDAEGRVQSETGAGGGVTQYRYDAAGRLSMLTTPEGLTIERHLDGAGRLASEYHSTGAVTFYRHSPAGRLFEVVHNSAAGELVAAHGYGYDADGQIELAIRLPAAGVTETTRYVYDPRGWLAEAIYPDGSQQRFEYDRVGNRRHVVDRGADHWYTHDAANQLLHVDDREVGGERLETYTYDQDGRRTSWSSSTRGVWAYGYDASGALESVAGEGADSWRYGYDIWGRRISQESPEGVSRYAWSRGNRTEVHDAGGLSSRATYGPGLDSLMALQRGGEILYVQRDAMENVVGLGAADGSQVADYQYDAFGAPRSPPSGFENDFAYMSRERDTNGLLYFRARFYDPIAGRYLTPDPLDLSAGVNFYAFVSNNPVNLRDPSGLCAEPVSALFCAGGMIVGAGVIGVGVPALISNLVDYFGGVPPEQVDQHNRQLSEVFKLVSLVAVLAPVQAGGIMAVGAPGAVAPGLFEAAAANPEVAMTLAAGLVGAALAPDAPGPTTSVPGFLIGEALGAASELVRAADDAAFDSSRLIEAPGPVNPVGFGAVRAKKP